MTSDLFAENLAVDLELASIRSPLPWGDIAGKEIIAYLEDLGGNSNTEFYTDSNGLGMIKRSIGASHPLG